VVRVLIIDNDPDICLFFETIFEKMGCETVSAKRINEAKKLSIGSNYDMYDFYSNNFASYVEDSTRDEGYYILFKSE